MRDRSQEVPYGNSDYTNTKALLTVKVNLRKNSLNKDLHTSTNLSKICAAFICYLFFAVQLLHAQIKPAPEYQVKAVFLFNFTRFIDWPSTAFSSANAPFVIGIMGTDPFGDYIEEIVKGENIQGHPIIIQRYPTAKNILNCHILFINTHESIQIKETLSSVGRKSILTVSDANNFAKLGGVVRFYKEDNKIKLEINITSSKAAQLEISSKLLSVARIFDSPGN